jgi:hypothetical protein
MQPPSSSFARVFVPVVALAFACSVATGIPLRPDVAAPPTEPAVEGGAFAPPSAQQHAAPDAGTQQYSIGDPTAEEQLNLEYINRARANPAAEGERLAATTDPDVVRAYGQWVVNLALMRTQLALIAPQPPLSMNSSLLNMARAQSQNMFNHGYQGHGDFHQGPSTTGTRFNSSGYSNGAYSWSYGENVFSYSYSVFYGHAGFEVDWGAGIGGMQVPPGHRNNIHGNFSEVGVGIVNGTRQVGGRPPVGPQLVTQEFARRDDDAFITGVIYDDRNNNGFYDVGEGIGGVRVDVPGADHYAISTASGGYSVPVDLDGDYTAHFSGGGVPAAQRSATITNRRSAKVDLVTAVAANTTNLGNISTRAKVGRLSESKAMIGGFIVKGAGEKKLIIRALGPTLSQHNVPGVIANPFLQIYQGQTPIASNDDWSTGADVGEIIAHGFGGILGSESALMVRLPAGSYTAVVNGVGDGTGNGIVEVYDVDPASPAKLANISTRADVGVNDDVMIGGLIVKGTGTQKMVIRAIGPTLTQFGVAGALANPSLRIVNSATNVEVISNNDWASGPSAAELTALNFAPGQPAEAAVVVNLAPGGYTAIVSGEGGTSGVALIEAYAID